ncbi:hypothetical protein C7H19_14615 [Aphanothece hegewaldii CCALA 016]|uniref:Uncharacterized protein n=1 Tax=Aphanothece hegewaldii CCALA 016 TaxID=2107694 RepID=A0A2T1LVU8_9CHRO|nr:hypothetical protein [Aphanothece hegewaldii]PSF35977.1 hypothetical protein C7H19_14615 [Aphanothece hegewaldii CCALA 016]
MTNQIAHQKLPFILKDSVSQQSVRGKVAHINNGLEIYFDGYGNYSCEPTSGSTILIEVFEQSLRVIIWGDIQQEDPTHVIELDGAREALRVKINEYN